MKRLWKWVASALAVSVTALALAMGGGEGDGPDCDDDNSCEGQVNDLPPILPRPYYQPEYCTVWERKCYPIEVLTSTGVVVPAQQCVFEMHQFLC